MSIILLQLIRLTFSLFFSSEKRAKKATAEGNYNFWPNILDMSSRWRVKREAVSHVHSCDTSPMTTTRIHFGFLVLFKCCKPSKVLKNKSTNLNEKQKNCWIIIWEDVVEEMADSGNGTGSLYFAKILYIKLFFFFQNVLWSDRCKWKYLWIHLFTVGKM